MKKTCIWAAICAVAAIATACGGSASTEPATTTAAATTTVASPTEETSPTAAAEAATITIAGNNFGEPVTVPPGAQVTVVNNDAVEHSVTSQTGGQFDVHVEGNEEGTLTAPNQPGEYAFYCVYHPNMKGTLIVQ
jgi:plastocyanin